MGGFVYMYLTNAAYKKVHRIAVGQAGRPDVLLPDLQEVLPVPAGMLSTISFMVSFRGMAFLPL